VNYSFKEHLKKIHVMTPLSDQIVFWATVCTEIMFFFATVSNADDDSNQSPPDYTVRPKLHDIGE